MLSNSLWKHGVDRSGRNVTADNFFTFIPLAGDLLKDGLTFAGTIRSNKPHIPDSIKANSTRKGQSSMFGFQSPAPFGFICTKGEARSLCAINSAS